jgi:hypothetical protein
MNLLYLINGDNIEECLQRNMDEIKLLNIIVRADSYDEAGDIARDVAKEMPKLRDTKKLDVEINALAEPISEGKGYCYPTEPTIKRRLILHE